MIAEFALPIAAMLTGAGLVLSIEYIQSRREVTASRKR